MDPNNTNPAIPNSVLIRFLSFPNVVSFVFSFVLFSLEVFAMQMNISITRKQRRVQLQLRCRLMDRRL